MVSTAMTENPYDSVLTAETLTEEILQKLFRDEISALRIPNYCSPEALVSMRKFIQGAQENFIKSYYVGYKDKKPTKKFYGINLWGTPYNSTYHQLPKNGAFEKYFQDALTHINAFRKAVAPYLSPMDCLRLQLDEHWPGGARIGTFPKDKNMFVGVCRFVYASDSFLGEKQPHFDSLPKHIRNLEKQYSANIYMDIPEMGGELEIWDVPPFTHEDVVEADIHKDWRSILPLPLVLKPKPGELILFNTRRPHAVRGFKRGIRSSIQCFIGLYTDGSLEFWS